MYHDLTVVIPCKGDDCQQAEELVAQLPCSWSIIRNHLYGEAIKQGIREAHTKYVGTMDADGQHQVVDLLRLYHELVRGEASMVIGRRKTRDPGPRALSSCLLNLTASILCGKHVPDFGSGLRVFERDTALSLMDRLPDGFDFNAALTMGYMVHGYIIRWIPITVTPRRFGKSHVRFRDGITTLKTLCQARRPSM